MCIQIFIPMDSGEKKNSKKVRKLIPLTVNSCAGSGSSRLGGRWDRKLIKRFLRV